MAPRGHGRRPTATEASRRLYSIIAQKRKERAPYIPRRFMKTEEVDKTPLVLQTRGPKDKADEFNNSVVFESRAAMEQYLRSVNPNRVENYLAKYNQYVPFTRTHDTFNLNPTDLLINLFDRYRENISPQAAELIGTRKLLPDGTDPIPYVPKIRPPVPGYRPPSPPRPPPGPHHPEIPGFPDERPPHPNYPPPRPPPEEGGEDGNYRPMYPDLADLDEYDDDGFVLPPRPRPDGVPGVNALVPKDQDMMDLNNVRPVVPFRVDPDGPRPTVPVPPGAPSARPTPPSGFLPSGPVDPGNPFQPFAPGQEPRNPADVRPYVPAPGYQGIGPGKIPGVEQMRNVPPFASTDPGYDPNLGINAYNPSLLHVGDDAFPVLQTGTELEDIRARHAAQEAQLTYARQMLKQHEGTISTLQSKIAAAEVDANQGLLEQQHAAATRHQQRVEELLGQIADLRNRNEDTLQQLQEAQAARQTLTAQQGNLNQRIEELESEVDYYERLPKAAPLIQPMPTPIPINDPAAQEEIQRLRAQNQGLQTESATTAAEMASLSARLEGTINALKAKLTASEQAAAQLTSRLVSLEEQELERDREAEISKGKVKGRLRDANAETQRLRERQDAANLAVAERHRNELAAQRRDLEARIANLTARNQELERHKSAIDEARVQETEALKNEVERLHHDIDAGRGDKAALERQLVEAQRALESKEGENAALITGIRETEGQRQAHAHAAALAQSQLDNAQRELGAVAARERANEARIVELNGEIEALRNRLDYSEGSVRAHAALEGDHRRSLRLIQDLQANIDMLSRRDEQHSLNDTASQQIIAALRQDLANAPQNQRAFADEYERRQQQIIRLNTMIDQREATIRRLEEEAAQNVGDRRSGDARIRNLKELMRQEKEELTRENEALVQRLRSEHAHEIAALQRSKEGVSIEAQKYKDDYENADIELRGAMASEQKLKDQNSHLMEQIRNLQVRIYDAEVNNQQLVQQLESLEEAKSRLDSASVQSSKDLSAQLTRVQSELVTKDQENALKLQELRSQLGAATSRNAALMSQQQTLDTRTAGLEQTNEQLNSSMTQTNTQLTAAQRAHEEEIANISPVLQQAIAPVRQQNQVDTRASQAAFVDTSVVARVRELAARFSRHLSVNTQRMRNLTQTTAADLAQLESMEPGSAASQAVSEGIFSNLNTEVALINNISLWFLRELGSVMNQIMAMSKSSSQNLIPLLVEGLIPTDFSDPFEAVLQVSMMLYPMTVATLGGGGSYENFETVINDLGMSEQLKESMKLLPDVNGRPFLYAWVEEGIQMGMVALDVQLAESDRATYVEMVQNALSFLIDNLPTGDDLNQKLAVYHNPAYPFVQAVQNYADMNTIETRLDEFTAMADEAEAQQAQQMPQQASTGQPGGDGVYESAAPAAVPPVAGEAAAPRRSERLANVPTVDYSKMTSTGRLSFGRTGRTKSTVRTSKPTGKAAAAAAAAVKEAVANGPKEPRYSVRSTRYSKGFLNQGEKNTGIGVKPSGSRKAAEQAKQLKAARKKQTEEAQSAKRQEQANRNRPKVVTESPLTNKDVPLPAAVKRRGDEIAVDPTGEGEEELESAPEKPQYIGVTEELDTRKPTVRKNDKALASILQRRELRKLKRGEGVGDTAEAFLNELESNLYPDLNGFDEAEPERGHKQRERGIEPLAPHSDPVQEPTYLTGHGLQGGAFKLLKRIARYPTLLPRSVIPEGTSITTNLTNSIVDGVQRARELTLQESTGTIRPQTLGNMLRVSQNLSSRSIMEPSTLLQLNIMAARNTTNPQCEKKFGMSQDGYHVQPRHFQKTQVLDAEMIKVINSQTATSTYGDRGAPVKLMNVNNATDMMLKAAVYDARVAKAKEEDMSNEQAQISQIYAVFGDGIKMGDRMFFTALSNNRLFLNPTNLSAAQSMNKMSSNLNAIVGQVIQKPDIMTQLIQSNFEVLREAVGTTREWQEILEPLLYTSTFSNVISAFKQTVASCYYNALITAYKNGALTPDYYRSITFEAAATLPFDFNERFMASRKVIGDSLTLKGREHMKTFRRHTFGSSVLTKPEVIRDAHERAALTAEFNASQISYDLYAKMRNPLVAAIATNSAMANIRKRKLEDENAHTFREKAQTSAGATERMATEFLPHEGRTEVSEIDNDPLATYHKKPHQQRKELPVQRKPAVPTVAQADGTTRIPHFGVAVQNTHPSEITNVIRHPLAGPVDEGTEPVPVDYTPSIHLVNNAPPPTPPDSIEVLAPRPLPKNPVTTFKTIYGRNTYPAEQPPLMGGALHEQCLKDFATYERGGQKGVRKPKLEEAGISRAKQELIFKNPTLLERAAKKFNRHLVFHPIKQSRTPYPNGRPRLTIQLLKKHSGGRMEVTDTGAISILKALERHIH